jgi:putative ABC transport system permease protein
MGTFLQDLRFGARMLARTPVVTLVAALSLALGIAATATVVALHRAMVLEPLPFAQQNGLVLVRELRHGETVEFASGASAPNFRDWREAVTAFTGMAAFSTRTQNITGVEQPEQIQVAVGTPNLFEVLGVGPALGRAFRPDEGSPGSAPVVVITHPYWTRHFHADPEVLGRTLTLDGIPHTVVGLMPESFEMLPAGVRVFRPMDLLDQEDRASRGWMAFGRLRPGATVAQARSELTSIHARLEREYPDANRGWGVLVQPARKWFPGPTDIKLNYLLLAVSLFGVAIAGANVANLLLARAEARMKEMAVRTALGAGRGRILRQLLTESTLLALAAAALGLLFSLYSIRGLRASIPPTLPRTFLPALDPLTIGAALAVAVAAGLLFGLAPALHAARGEFQGSLGEGSRGGTAGRRRKRLRSLFVVGQVAVALALLSGAGGLREAGQILFNPEPGFTASGLLTFTAVLPEYRYPGAPEIREMQEDLLRTLEGIPGVEGVALMSTLPRSQGNPSARFQVVGREVEDPEDRPLVHLQAVSPDYFGTLEIQRVEGRLLEARDREGAPSVAVVNRELARRFFQGEVVVGKRIDIQGEPRQVVGMVENVAQARIAFDGIVEPAVYVPAAQAPRRSFAVALRSAGDPSGLAAKVRGALRAVDPDQPMANLRTLEDHIQEELAAPWLLLTFVTVLGFLAVGLSALGLYGVMAFTVVQERREIGIRMAMGARGARVVGMVARRGLALTGVGLLLGTPLAFVLHRAVLATLDLFQLELALTFTLGAVAVLVASAALASYLPARKAATVQPARVLASE